MQLPSVKKLQDIPRLTPEDAKAIRLWLGYAESWVRDLAYPAPMPADVADWVARCYHRPSKREVAHAVIASIITEGRTTSWECHQPQEDWASFTEGPSWEAVEVGDPYIPTLIRRNGNYRVACWGDLREVNQ